MNHTGSGRKLCVSHTSLLPPIHVEAVWGTFSVLAARKMPPGAEMSATNTKKPHCGRSKWIGGKPDTLVQREWDLLIVEDLLGLKPEKC